MRVLVTGGAGYIGSHTCVDLLAAGYDVTILDNFSNSDSSMTSRIEQIAGRKIGAVIDGDIRDASILSRALEGAQAVIHFAGLKAVGESVEKPEIYYDNNVIGTLRLLEAMKETGAKNLVFSSSATVYGDPVKLPISEMHPLSAANPYGRTKIIIEDMLRDFYHADGSWRFALLRYFNPVGAHDSGLIGEMPRGVPNNLMPYVADVAMGRRPEVNVFGSDYDTPDGTGVRDYIHVVDLAAGHLAALKKVLKDSGMFAVNLGTGRGVSVLEIVAAYEKACGKKIPVRMCPRRAGDVASCYADVTFAKNLLGWSAVRSLEEMCSSSWRWRQSLDI